MRGFTKVLVNFKKVLTQKVSILSRFIYLNKYLHIIDYTVVSANLSTNPYRTLTKLISKNSQKLLKTNLKMNIYKYIYRTGFALSEYNKH